MTKDFSYSELPTSNLKWEADREANQFELPGNWRDGRTVREGYAIDDPHSNDRDDAIAYENGILRVSIADIGSFAVNLPAVTAYAQRVTGSRYTSDQVSRSMLPSALSERKLSLLHEQERPGITFHIPIDKGGELGELSITKDVIRATSISAAEVDLIPFNGGEETHTPFHDLRDIATTLYLRRHPNKTLAMEDYEGRLLSSSRFSIGKFVVRECMIIARIMAGQYIADHDIPAIFTRHDVPTTLKLLGEIASEHEQKMARVSLTAMPDSRHIGLNARNVVSITSPLREFAAYANQSNLVAHLDGRESFLGRGAIGYVVSRYNRVRHTPARAPEVKRKDIIYASEVRQKMENGTLAPAEISQLFFGLVMGEDEEISELRQETFGMLLTRGAEARSAIEIAVERRLVEVITENGQTFLVDRAGKRTPYARPEGKSHGAVAIANNALVALSERAGIPVGETEITEALRRNAILKNGRKYMRDLSLKIRTPINETMALHEETGEHTCTISMRIRGRLETRTANSADPDEAARLAYSVLITELDLINNPPVWVRTEQDSNRYAIQELKRWITETPKADPRNLLSSYVQRNHLKAVSEYTIGTNENGRPSATCIIRVIKEQKAEDGATTETELHTSTAVADNKSDARLLASERLVTQLNLQRPKRPKPQSRRRR